MKNLKLSEAIFGATAVLWFPIATALWLLGHWMPDVREVGVWMLVAGGIGMGALLDRSGAVHQLAAGIPLAGTSETLRLLGLCVLASTLAALMSNTGTAALLIPLAATIDPAPSTAIIIAVATSLAVTNC